MPKMQVESVKLRYARFAENPDFNSDVEQTSFSFEIGGGHLFDEDEKTLYVDLGVRTPEDEEVENVPFFFDVMYQGAFVFSDACGEDDIEKLASINCPAIILPYVRECLSDLIRRADLPPFALPLVNFVKHAQERGLLGEDVDGTSKSKAKKASKKVKKAAPKKSKQIEK